MFRRIVGGAGKRVRGGGNHYTGSYTDATGTRRGKAGWECGPVAIDDATRLARGRATQASSLTLGSSLMVDSNLVVFAGRTSGRSAFRR